MTCTTIIRSVALPELPHLDRARAAAARDEPRDRLVGEREDLDRTRVDRVDRSRDVVHAYQLDLADHQRRIDLAREAAARAHHLRGVRRGGDDAGLLDDHRHDVVVAVDADVERDAVRERVRPEDVLDELVGRLRVEAPLLERALDVPRVGPRRLAHEGAALCTVTL